MKRYVFCLLLIFHAFPLLAETPLANADAEARATHLFRLLRCEVCAGQSIYDSNAPLATDMRQEVRELISQGKTEDEILQLYAKRFGDQVLMRPPVKESTWPLWFFPLFALAAGGWVIFRLLHKKESA